MTGKLEKLQGTGTEMEEWKQALGRLNLVGSNLFTLTKLLSLAYCLFTKHPSVRTLPHAAVTDVLAKISYMAIH